MNSLDSILQSVAPMVMVPRYESLTPIRPNSHRFLSCADGIYLEVHRPWIHGVFKISDLAIKLPYGQVEPRFALNIYSDTFMAALSEFIQEARTTSPVEHAAWLTYHPNQEVTLQYCAPRVISSSNGHIRYERPDASAECLPAFDCHSHGATPAYFSRTDNHDDLKDDLKIAIVVGNLDKEIPSIVARLVGMGLNVNLSEWVQSLVQNYITETHLN